MRRRCRCLASRLCRCRRRTLWYKGNDDQTGHISWSRSRLCDPLTDSETEAEAATLGHPGAHTISAPEALEDVRKVGGGDSNSGVAHGKGDVVGMTTEPDVHLSTRGSVLDGVGDEVEKEL